MWTTSGSNHKGQRFFPELVGGRREVSHVRKWQLVDRKVIADRVKGELAVFFVPEIRYLFDSFIALKKTQKLYERFFAFSADDVVNVRRGK